MFSPDGHALACGGFTDKVLLWADEGSAPRVFARLPIQADARSVGFDREGRFLLSWVPGDPELRAWPLAGGAPVTLLAYPELVRPLNGDEVATLGHVASGARERVLRRWSFDGDVSELARWNPPSAFRFRRPPGLRPVSVASTLRWLAFGDGVEVVLRSLDAPAAAVFRLGRHETDVRDVEFDPAGQKLVSVDQSGVLRLWSVRDRTLLRELRSSTSHRYSRLVFDDGGRFVSWASGEGSTHVWDLRAPADARPLELRRTDAGDVGDEAFDPQGRWLASAAGGGLALWPIQSAYSRVLVGHVEGPVSDLAFSPDSTRLASCTRDGALVWPLDAGQKRRVDLGADYYCYGVTFSPDGRELAVVAPSLGTYLVPLDGAPPRRLFDYRDKSAAYIAVAFNRAARTLAVAPEYATTHADMAVEVQDLATGARRAVPLWDQDSADGFVSSASYLRYLADGRLLAAGRNGIRRWDPATGKLERLLWGTRFAAIDTDQLGRTIVALVGTLSVNAMRLSDPELLVIDPNGRTLDRISGHGNALTPTLAVDARGRFLVTGDTQGIVRVGLLSGREPHWLPGHSGPVERVAVSPDGRWIASASGAEIRLWPVPDLSKPPFHTLPYDQLMAKLKALTNLRVVDDPGSPNGYRVEVGPFPGWREVPTW
jgi:WD40 repeat protein